MNQSFLIENFKALGTIWYIELFEILEENNLKKIKNEIEKAILDLEKKYSRFNPESLLSTLNTKKECEQDIQMSEMINIGESWYRETGGAFDIFIKQRLEDIGYGNNSSDHLGKGSVMEEQDQERVSFGKEKVILKSKKEIDLGGLGKGYLIDKIAEHMQKLGLKYFLINGGGDIYATSDNGEPIEILLEHPTEKEIYIGKIHLKDQSLCASSSFKRAWVKNGKEYNHFIDTKNGNKIEGASFVVGDNATEADIFASVCVLLSNNIEKLEKISDKKNLKYFVIDGENAYASEVFQKAIKDI